MKKPYLSQDARLILHLHRKGIKTIMSAGLEFNLARYKLCKTIIKTILK